MTLPEPVSRTVTAPVSSGRFFSRVSKAPLSPGPFSPGRFAGRKGEAALEICRDIHSGYPLLSPRSIPPLDRPLGGKEEGRIGGFGLPSGQICRRIGG